MVEAGSASEVIPARSGVVRTGLLSMLGLVALGATRVIHGSLVSRATDENTYGLVGILIGVGMTAGLFLPLGLSTAAAKFIPFHTGRNDPGTARGVYQLLSWASVATAVILGALVGVGTAALLSLGVADTVALSLFTAVFSVYSVEKGALYGFDRVAPYARLEIAGSILAIVATVVVVVAGGRAYLAPLTIGYSVLIIGAWILLRRGPTRTGARVPRAERREIAEFVLMASAGGLASAGLLQLLPLLAVGFTSRSEVAYFAAGVTLVAPLYFLPRALSMALFPAMAHAHGAGDTDVVRRHTDLSTRALLVVLAPMFALAIPLAREVLILFSKPSYAAGAIVLQLLLVATYVSVSQVAATNALSSGTRREVRIPVISGIFGCVVGLAVLAPLGSWLGAAGVGLAYLVGVVAYTTAPIVAAWRRYRMNWTGPLVRSVSVVAASLALAIAADATHVAGAGRVLLDVALALGVAAAGAVLLRRDIRALIAARSRAA